MTALLHTPSKLFKFGTVYDVLQISSPHRITIVGLASLKQLNTFIKYLAFYKAQILDKSLPEVVSKFFYSPFIYA
jgi:hypothetical protein